MTAATTCLPALALRLVADMTTALPDVTVTLGHDLSESRTALMVLVDDPLSESALANGSSDISWRTTGPFADMDESGTITCAIVCQDGADMSAAIDTGLAILNTVELWARESHGTDLGIASLTEAHVSRVNWAPFQGPSGAELLLTFDLSFTALLGG